MPRAFVSMLLDRCRGAYGGGPAVADAEPVRLAAIDWAMLEIAVGIGDMPVAACELIRYRDDVGSPRIPLEVVDLGLRGAPNFELLQLTRPSLILSSPYYAQYEHRLRRLAPVLSLPFFLPEEPPPKAMQALTTLAEHVDHPSAGRAALELGDKALDAAAARLSPHSARPVALVDIGDARHLRAFGFDSLFGSTPDRLRRSLGSGQDDASGAVAPVL